MTTTTAGGATVEGGTTTTSLAPATGTAPPTIAPLPLNPPPVEALAPGEAVPDPAPQIIAFVVDPGDRIVVLGTLSPEQVRRLFQELADRHLPHTGNNSGTLVAIAMLALVLGGALLAMVGRRRQRPQRRSHGVIAHSTDRPIRSRRLTDSGTCRHRAADGCRLRAVPT